MTDRERLYDLAIKLHDYAIKLVDLKQENTNLKKQLAKLKKPKRKFRAMTYKEHCKSLCLICEECCFAPNWADMHYKQICPIWNKSSNDFNKPCKLPNGKYILIEVKE